MAEDQHPTDTDASDDGAGLIPFLLSWGPLFFGVGFLAPLIAQSLDAIGLEVPFLPSNLVFGLIVGVLGGLAARRRGGWL